LQRTKAQKIVQLATLFMRSVKWHKEVGVDFEAYAIDLFKAANLDAKKIPESSEKTPDFIIFDDVNILVEVKEKQDNKKVIAERDDAFKKGEVFERVQGLGYKNRLSGIVDDAAKQLKAQKGNTNSEFCFIFIVMTGLTPSAQISQFADTLYGKKHVLDAGLTGSIPKECYYFTHSEFFKHSDVIDGVFLVQNGYLELLINDQSPRYDKVINSTFVNRFQGNITDPVKLEREGKILCVKSDIPRKNEDLVKKFVFDKYGIEKGLVFDYPHYSFQAELG
jgi:hypothetical protein